VRQCKIYGTAFDDPGTPLFDVVRSGVGLRLADSSWPALQVAQGRRRVSSAGVTIETIDRSATPGRHVAVLDGGELVVTSNPTLDLLERTLVGLRGYTSGQDTRLQRTNAI
jgi:hypothetical protein